MQELERRALVTPRAGPLLKQVHAEDLGTRKLPDSTFRDDLEVRLYAETGWVIGVMASYIYTTVADNCTSGTAFNPQPRIVIPGDPTITWDAPTVGAGTTFGPIMTTVNTTRIAANGGTFYRYTADSNDERVITLQFRRSGPNCANANQASVSKRRLLAAILGDGTKTLVP